MNRENPRKVWQNNLVMTAGVMATVLAGLILAQLDALQSRVTPDRSRLPIVNIQATAVAIGQVIPLLIAPESGETGQEAAPVVIVPDDQNPRPEIITSISEEGVIFTVCGEVPEGWLLYTVQPGDTLASLAAAVQSTEAELAAANCLSDGSLTAGMQILVPREPVEALCGPPSFWVRYQVQRGDTLGALARSRGTSVDEILRANCRETLDLIAGQLIFLPPGSGSGSAPIGPQPSLTPLPTPTLLPTGTIAATFIPTQPPFPTSAPFPTATFAFPTLTPVGPTATPPIPPTPVTPTPFVPTDTPPPPPTDTPPPPPTDTPPPPPTDTPPPPPTDTPPPPTDTPPPPPTDTPPPPPTDTPPPPPTEPSPTEEPLP
jgi:LysM repeat protein